MSGPREMAGRRLGGASTQQDDEALEGLVLAARTGDMVALLALREALDPGLRWPVRRATRRLHCAPALERDDLSQEMWLALMEEVRNWNPDSEVPLRAAVERAARRQLRRALRVNHSDQVLITALEGAHQADTPRPEPADEGVHADASRWADISLGQSLVAALPDLERQALVLRAVHERPMHRIAQDLGLSRRGVAVLLVEAQVHALALAGAPPRAGTLEATVLAAVREGADGLTGRAPTTAWLKTRLGMGRQRVRASMRRLGELGYVRPTSGRWWRLAGFARHADVWETEG